MSDTKMLQLVLDKISNLHKKLDLGFKKVDKRFDELDERIDNLGLQLARLEDDAPTMEDHEQLAKRVDKVEDKVASL